MHHALATSSAVAAILGGGAPQTAQGFTPNTPDMGAGASNPNPNPNFEKALADAASVGAVKPATGPGADQGALPPLNTAAPGLEETGAESPLAVRPTPIDAAPTAPAIDDGETQNLDQLIAEFISGDMPIKPIIIAPDSVLVDVPTPVDAPQLSEEAIDAAPDATPDATTEQGLTLDATPLANQDTPIPLTPIPAPISAQDIAIPTPLTPTETSGLSAPLSTSQGLAPIEAAAPVSAPASQSLPVAPEAPQVSASPLQPSGTASRALAPNTILPESASAQTAAAPPPGAAPLPTDGAKPTAQHAAPAMAEAPVTEVSAPSAAALPAAESAQSEALPLAQSSLGNSTITAPSSNTASAATSQPQAGAVIQPSVSEGAQVNASVGNRFAATQPETAVAANTEASAASSAKAPSAGVISATAQSAAVKPTAEANAATDATIDASALKAKTAASGLRTKTEQAIGRVPSAPTEATVQPARPLPTAAQAPATTPVMDAETAAASTDAADAANAAAPVDLTANARPNTAATSTDQSSATAPADTATPSAATASRDPALGMAFNAPVELVEQEAQTSLNRARSAADTIENAAKNPANAAAAQKFASTMAQQAPAAQVAFAIARNAGDVPDRIRINLFPEELGNVEILMEVHDNRRTEIVIRAERPETVELMQRDARELQRALQMAGLDVNANDMSFEQGEKNTADSFAGEFGSENEHYDDEPDSEQPVDAFAPIPLRWRSMTPGGVDMVA